MQRLRVLCSALILVLISASPALAESADLSKVQSFAQNVIQVLVTIAGLLAAGFFVVGGIGYITSSGNPENLDKSKKTILYSSIGLAVSIAAFVLSNIVTELATTAFGR
ncbi:MAG: pilin [Candidatus Berkelbacteria bacterium]